MGVGLAGRMELGSLPLTLGEHLCCSKAVACGGSKIDYMYFDDQ